MQQEKRMAENYEIMHAIHIGDREVVFGADDNNLDAPYMCSYCTENDIFKIYSECMVGNDYLELMALFFSRLQEQVTSLLDERARMLIQADPITAEQCIPNDYSQDIRGKLVAIALSNLRREYQGAVYQVCLVESGSGAHADPKGRAVYVTELYSGNKARWNRSDILGIIKQEYIADWMKERLNQIFQKKMQKPGQEINQGYVITDRVTVGHAVFVLGENKETGNYVTWQRGKDISKGYDWGHYFTDREKAVEDLHDRAAKVQKNTQRISDKNKNEHERGR